MNLEDVDRELAETRKVLDRVKQRMQSFEELVLNDQIRFLKGLLDNEKEPNKMFALIAAIRGIEDYLNEP